MELGKYFEDQCKIESEAGPSGVQQNLETTSTKSDEQIKDATKEKTDIPDGEPINNLQDMLRLNLKKYWYRRGKIFSKYDKGIQLDTESWYSITEEKQAKHHASRCSRDMVIVDAMCGAGGNAIQFATYCKKVIAIDISEKKLDLARNNAEIYNVTNKIEFKQGDFFEIAPSLKADVVFLGPPWGSPTYGFDGEFDLLDLMDGRGVELFKAAQTITKNIIYFVPKNIKIPQLVDLEQDKNGVVKIEGTYRRDLLKAFTAYYGDLAIPNYGLKRANQDKNDTKSAPVHGATRMISTKFTLFD